MAKFKSIEEAYQYVQDAVSEIVENDFPLIMKAVEEKHIEVDVYAAYSPKVYKRRHDMGSNIQTLAEGTSITMINTTPPNDYYDEDIYAAGSCDLPTMKDLPSVIEYGEGYDYWAEPFPRPFTKRTADELRDSGVLAESLKRGLRARGIVVARGG